MKKNLFYLIISVIFLSSCSGGGGSSSGSSGGNGNNDIATVTKEIIVQKNKSFSLGIPSSYSNLKIETNASFGEINLNSLTYLAYSNEGSDYFRISYNYNQSKYIVAYNVQITEVNNPPMIQKTEFFIERGNGEILDFQISDEDISSVRINIISFPSVGELTFINQNGRDRLAYDSDNSLYQVKFEIKIIDNIGQESIKEITINSIDPNTNPIMNEAPLSYNINEDSNPILISYTVSDNEDSNIIHTISQEPNNGTITGAYPNYNYKPNANFYGTDSFEISLNDGRGGVTKELISIVVSSVNDIPQSSNKIFDAVKNSSFNVFNLGILDPDHDEFIYDIVEDIGNGIYFINDEGYMTYIPNENYIGQETLVLRISDGESFSEEYTYLINVEEENISYPISLENKSVSINKNETVEINLNYQGNIGDVTEIYIKEPINGLAFFENGTIFYIPSEDYIGTDLIELKIKDSESNESNSAIISIEVKEKNYSLFGYTQIGEENKDELNNQFSIISNNNFTLYKNSADSFDLVLNNVVNCESTTDENVSFVNLISNSNFFTRSLNYQIDLSNADCNQDKFNLLENGDSLISSGNNSFLLNKNNDIYFGINALDLNSFSSIDGLNINSLSFKDISIGDSSENLGTTLNDAYIYAENSFNEFKNYLKIPNGNIYYNESLTSYYSLVYEENGEIKTRGVFIKNESDIMIEIPSMNFYCEEPEINAEGSDIEFIAYFDGKDVEDIMMDDTVLVTDEAEQLSIEEIPSNINYVVVVEDLETFSDLEDVEIAYIILRSNCINNQKNIDVSVDNGVVLLLENKIVHSLYSKFNEEVVLDDETNEEERSIENVGNHLIIYEYE